MATSETERFAAFFAGCLATGWKTSSGRSWRAEVKEREYGLILSKTATREPIDSLSALAMAVDWAASIEPPGRASTKNAS